jgi:anti-sigma B factor antagonist
MPHGEIDLASVEELATTLRELRENGFHHLVLDLRGVTFMDSTGLRLILTWDDASRRDGIEFRLIPGPPIVQRLFEITGVAGQLPFVDPPQPR